MEVGVRRSPPLCFLFSLSTLKEEKKKGSKAAGTAALQIPKQHLERMADNDGECPDSRRPAGHAPVRQPVPVCARPAGIPHPLCQAVRRRGPAAGPVPDILS